MNMGLLPDVVEWIVSDVARDPNIGDVLTLGRQTVYATPGSASSVLNKKGIRSAIDAYSIDRTTQQYFNDKKERIDDISFFKALGAKTVKSIDVSDFEGAEIVHNLNHPIPDSLESICDFLVDGSLLDNIWNPQTALQSIARMIRPGGRCILTNRENAGGPGIAYVMLPGAWFYDFFVINDFHYVEVACRITMPDGYRATYQLSPAASMKAWGSGRIASFLTTHSVETLVMAEKGPNSTWDRMPTQMSYRSEAEWQVFFERIQGFIDQRRPPLFCGEEGPDIVSETIKYGWLRVLPDGTRVRPQTGLKFLPDGTMVRPEGTVVPPHSEPPPPPA